MHSNLENPEYSKLLSVVLNLDARARIEIAENILSSFEKEEDENNDFLLSKEEQEKIDQLAIEVEQGKAQLLTWEEMLGNIR